MFKKIILLLALSPIIGLASEQPQETDKWIAEHIKADEPLTNAHLAAPASTTYTFKGGRFGDHIQTDHPRFRRPDINPSTGTLIQPPLRPGHKELYAQWQREEDQEENHS